MIKNINIRFSIVVLAILAILCAMAYYYRHKTATKIQHYETAQNNIPENNTAPLKNSVKAVSNDVNQQKTSSLPYPKKNYQTESGLELPKLAPVEAGKDIAGEKSRREGYLWVDKVTKKYIVTLGNINGVFPGGYLTVYDNDIRIGQVRVVTSFDVISYVEPIAADKSDLTKDYYQVYNE